MSRFLFISALVVLASAALAESGLEGRGATITVEIKGLARTNGVLETNRLVASGTIKSSELSSGLYFEPKNKLIDLEVGEDCRSIAELAFAQRLPYTVKGELKKFDEHFTAPNVAAFNETKLLRCEVLSAKE
jgi:hypothetical protein